jgi:hypothetical protein
VTGDEVRDIWLPLGGRGYIRTDVDELLGRIAAELDAGHPVAPLISLASFRKSLWLKGYDVDAVDWILAELVRTEIPQDVQPADSADAWRDLPVVNLLSRRSDVGVAEFQDADALAHSPLKRPARLRRLLAGHCAGAWRGFDQVPGPRLVFTSVRHGGDLHTADQRLLASVEERRDKKISIGGRTITFRPARKEPALLPVTKEIAERGRHDYYGHFCANPRRLPRRPGRLVDAVWVAGDETGAPVLFTSGFHGQHCAYTRISFPGERWLRFLVRGTDPSDAIMTAVDEAGKKVALYRRVGDDTEIIRHPDRRLTEELTVAIAASVPWLAAYFQTND